MYQLYSDFLGTLPLEQQFLIPIGYIILILLLILCVMRLLGVFRQ